MGQKLNQSIFHFPSAVGWYVHIVTDPEGRDEIEDCDTIECDRRAVGDPKTSSDDDEMND